MKIWWWVEFRFGGRIQSRFDPGAGLSGLSVCPYKTAGEPSQKLELVVSIMAVAASRSMSSVEDATHLSLHTR